MADEVVLGEEDDVLGALRTLQRDILAGMLENPAESLTLLVSGGAAVFYLAEREQNPSVQTYWDAFHYIATSLSVGYANIFPVTPIGKMVGALVMMVGPALSGRVFDGLEPAAPPAPPATDPVLLAKLDEILGELKRIAS